MNSWAWVFSGYGIAVVVLAAYVLSLARRRSRLARQLHSVDRGEHDGA